MDKIEMKVAICVLGVLFLLGVFQLDATGKYPVPSKKWKPPDSTVTLVLRAPTSNHPSLVTFSEAKGTETFKGLAVSLPRYTPVFFCVDLVNTALYTVTINVDTPGTVSESGRYKKYSVYEALAVIKKAQEAHRGWKNPPKSLLDAFACKVEAAHALNKELDALLQRTETPDFYNNPSATHIKKAFRKIGEAAKEKAKAKKLLELQDGTAQELCDVIEKVLQEIYRAYQQQKKEVPKDIPQDLSAPSKKTETIANVFLAVAEKLRAIETATWAQQSYQQYLLNNQIKYVCVFTPRVGTLKLKTKRLEVTVTPTIGLSGVQFSVGSFMTTLHDDHYVSDDNKIVLGAQDRLAMPLGALAHIPICGMDFSRFNSALALSTGFALGTASTHGQLVVNGQAALGGSLLFSSPTGEGDMFAVTFGGIVKPVKRLNGYWVGDPFPKDSTNLTRPVHRIGWFLALTANFKFLPKIFGFGKDDSSKKK